MYGDYAYTRSRGGPGGRVVRHKPLVQTFLPQEQKQQLRVVQTKQRQQQHKRSPQPPSSPCSSASSRSLLERSRSFVAQRRKQGRAIFPPRRASSTVSTTLHKQQPQESNLRSSRQRPDNNSSNKKNSNKPVSPVSVLEFEQVLRQSEQLDADLAKHFGDSFLTSPGDNRSISSSSTVQQTNTTVSRATSDALRADQEDAWSAATENNNTNNNDTSGSALNMKDCSFFVMEHARKDVLCATCPVPTRIVVSQEETPTVTSSTHSLAASKAASPTRKDQQVPKDDVVDGCTNKLKSMPIVEQIQDMSGQLKEFSTKLKTMVTQSYHRTSPPQTLRRTQSPTKTKTTSSSRCPWHKVPDTDCFLCEVSSSGNRMNHRVASSSSRQ